MRYESVESRRLLPAGGINPCNMHVYCTHCGTQREEDASASWVQKKRRRREEEEEEGIRPFSSGTNIDLTSRFEVKKRSGTRRGDVKEVEDRMPALVLRRLKYGCSFLVKVHRSGSQPEVRGPGEGRQWGSGWFGFDFQGVICGKPISVRQFGLV